MTKRAYRIFTAAFIFISLSFSSTGLTSDTQRDRESLRGLKGVFVTVERLDPEVEKDGLTAAQIRTDAESNLRRAGIKLLSKQEWFDSPGSPNLELNVFVLRLPSSPEYVYSINIALKQRAYLIREPIEVFGATTWSLGTITGITPHLDKIRSSVEAQVDKFIPAYVSVNP